MGKLVHFHDDGKAAEIRLDRQRITIGRRPDNDICLAYPAVSGEHAAVVTILADSFLEDLGRTNGTLVNGAAVTKRCLRDRDVLPIMPKLDRDLTPPSALLPWHPRYHELPGEGTCAAMVIPEYYRRLPDRWVVPASLVPRR